METWETGAERPGGMALKLSAVVQKHGLQILARCRTRNLAGRVES